MRLTHTINHLEKRKFGLSLINKQLDIVVEYDEGKKEMIEVISVNLFENKKFVSDIYELFNALPGNPLMCVLENINWEKKYQNLQIDQHLFFKQFKGIFKLFQS